ncbi:trypsin-like peptidase domain-containing protein [Streptomyces huiliensis]|uniref:trypsin-like peptidase domain-containing protein n=1 Tax=Streptomyces huiliensis TaxID=2876027 RepID=UPI001CC042D6|nr:trypsin-like peptidase domain-containing protein [Streptomyces huiliensis]MBZ4323602.1 trypsin-like serine protease [Streptomyces huiliensis]
MRRPLAVTALAALLLGLTALSPGGPAATADPGRRALAAAADAYWTADRMADALPAEAGRRAAVAPESVEGPAARKAPVPPSHPFDGLPQVGTFFWTDGHGQGRFCGGTVVRSPYRNLVVSAAHCLRRPDPKRRLSFVPQYHDGLKPHGVFPVEAIYIDQRYYDLGTDGGARWDYTVVRLGDRSDGTPVERVTGGFDLLFHPGYRHSDVRLIGYPGNSDTKYPKPLDCRSSTSRYTSTDPKAPGDFLEIPCAGYVGGTSGGPFLIRGVGGRSVLIGVIGGYHTGGDTPDVSYSSYFTEDLLDLYLDAVHGEPPAG